MKVVDESDARAGTRNISSSLCSFSADCTVFVRAFFGLGNIVGPPSYKVQIGFDGFYLGGFCLKGTTI